MGNDAAPGAGAPVEPLGVEPATPGGAARHRPISFTTWDSARCWDQTLIGGASIKAAPDNSLVAGRR